ncbi:MAG: transglutaminase-like domain-containing protein [Paludibacter sp.]
MKQICLILFILMNTGVLFAVDYSVIDKQSLTVPANKRTNSEIASYLTQNLSTPIEKIRAIFIWITHNISYDLDRMNAKITYFDQQELADDALQRRKGVCANYAALFDASCNSIGIRSYLVEGYVRQNGEPIYKSHAWNVVEIDKHFYFFDPTWAAGFMRNNEYVNEYRDNFFQIQPDEFIKTHMPLDPIWQCSTNPISYNEFDINDFQKLNSKSNFNFSDSIKSLSKLKNIDKLERENKRITLCGGINNYVREEMANLSVQINNENLRIQSEKYNEVVNHVNKAVNHFNMYIQTRTRDNSFTPRNKQRFLELLTSARNETLAGKTISISVNNWNSDLKNQISQLKFTIDDMFNNINREISDIKNH